jgi:hypothetical protein
VAKISVHTGRVVSSLALPEADVVAPTATVDTPAPKPESSFSTAAAAGSTAPTQLPGHTPIPVRGGLFGAASITDTAAPSEKVATLKKLYDQLGAEGRRLQGAGVFFQDKPPFTPEQIADIRKTQHIEGGSDATVARLYASRLMQVQQGVWLAICREKANDVVAGADLKALAAQAPMPSHEQLVDMVAFVIKMTGKSSFTTDELATYLKIRSLKDDAREAASEALPQHQLQYFNGWDKKDVIQNPNSTTGSCCGSHAHCFANNLKRAADDGVKIGGQALDKNDLGEMHSAFLGGFDGGAKPSGDLVLYSALDAVRKLVPDIDGVEPGWAPKDPPAAT